MLEQENQQQRKQSTSVLSRSGSRGSNQPCLSEVKEPWCEPAVSSLKFHALFLLVNMIAELFAVDSLVFWTTATTRTPFQPSISIIRCRAQSSYLVHWMGSSSTADCLFTTSARWYGLACTTYNDNVDSNNNVSTLA